MIRSMLTFVFLELSTSCGHSRNGLSVDSFCFSILFCNTLSSNSASSHFVSRAFVFKSIRVAAPSAQRAVSISELHFCALVRQRLPLPLLFFVWFAKVRAFLHFVAAAFLHLFLLLFLQLFLQLF